MSASIRSNADRFRRAAEIGRELAAIDRNPDLHRLSLDAWRRHALALGDFATPAELVAARARLETCPRLHRETVTLATLWARGQDRPAVSPIYTSPEREGLGAAYAERLAAGLSPEVCSAVAAVMCAELRDPGTFGLLSSHDALDTMTRPRLDELAVLDRELSTTVRLCDLAWQGSAPVLVAAGVTVPIGPGAVDRLASALAEAARHRPADLLAA